MSDFCKIESVPIGRNKQGDYRLPVWLDLENDGFEIKNLFFPTRYAAQKFRRTHEIINNEIVEAAN